MNVKIEKQEGSKIVIEFTMPKDDFNKELDKAFVKNSKYFKMPGFRTGKVPRTIVEKMYGDSVLGEAVVEDIADEAYQNAIKENNLEVVSRPELNIIQAKKDNDLVYTISVFVKPEVKVENYKGYEINKYDTTVKDEDIENELKEVQNKNARVVSVDDRALENGDISTIDFEGFVGEEAFEGGKGENYELEIGSGAFIPGFEEQLIGMNIGEEREINVKFPEEYHSEELKGKDAKFKVKLISIKSKDLPTLDDEFAKDVSEFETLEEYKKHIAEHVKEHKEEHARADKESQVIEKLVENTQVEIPECMIDDETESMLEQFNMNLSYQGFNIDKYLEYTNTSKEEFKSTLRPEAIKNIKLKLALEYIEKTEDLKVEDSKIDEEIEKLSSAYGNENADSLKKNENVRNYMKNKLSQDIAMDFVINASIEK